MSDTAIKIIVCFTHKKPLFELGEVYITIGAKHTLHDLKIDPASLLVRHITGEWGELPHDDVAENNYAVKHGGQILSSYQVSHEAKVWLITESDRSCTTILLPSEY